MTTVIHLCKGNTTPIRNPGELLKGALPIPQDWVWLG